MSVWVQSEHGDWDIALELGVHHEKRVRALFEGDDGTIEVKADQMWHTTGNVAVEYRFRGKPSGLSSTKAKWWGVVLTNKDDPKQSDMIILWETKKLKKHLRSMMHGLRKVSGGYRQASRLLLVPLREFIPLPKQTLVG